MFAEVVVVTAVVERGATTNSVDRLLLMIFYKMCREIV